MNDEVSIDKSVGKNMTDNRRKWHWSKDIATLATIVSILAVLGGGLAWFGHQEGVLATHTNQITELKESVKENKTDTNKKLDEISKKQDQLLDYLLNNKKGK
jgi:ribosomal protein S15P/S13E